MSVWLISLGTSRAPKPWMMKSLLQNTSARANLRWAIEPSLSWVNLLNTEVLDEKALSILLSPIPETLAASVTISLSETSL